MCPAEGIGRRRLKSCPNRINLRGVRDRHDDSLKDAVAGYLPFEDFIELRRQGIRLLDKEFDKVVDSILLRFTEEFVEEIIGVLVARVVRS